MVEGAKFTEQHQHAALARLALREAIGASFRSNRGSAACDCFLAESVAQNGPRKGLKAVE
jgi:hypothetical protein